MKSENIFSVMVIFAMMKLATPYPSDIDTTAFPTTVPYDPCSSCRDAPVQFTDIWAGQCVPRGDDINCRCECLSVFCRNHEIIDTTTCRSDGSIADCRCIPIETTTIETSSPSEPTTWPTTDPYDPCSSCRDAPVQFTDIWAGQCVPRGDDINCRCECLSIFCRNHEIIDTTTCRSDGSIADCRCIPIETTTIETSSPSEPTTWPTTDPSPVDPCSSCRDAPVQFTDTWAGQCVPFGEGASCQCACGSIFCRENEIIDRTTCRADGSLSDCRCIPIETTLPPTTFPPTTFPPTTFPPTTFPPTTFPPTTFPPDDPCSWCRDSPVQFTDTWAGQCFPLDDDISCQCVCGSIFCEANEIIDKTTCRVDGSLADCRCIPIETTLPPTTFPPTTFPPTTFPPTTFPPTTFPPTTFPPDDPCSWCRDAPVQFTDTWAGQCFSLDDDVSCQCVCGSIFCEANEIIDRTTCRADGSLADCRCIPIETTLPPTTIPNDPCDWCRHAPVQFTDTWAGQCFPLDDGVDCQCACGSIFCRDNEIIDRTTCRADGSLADCQCISIETTTATTN